MKQIIAAACAILIAYSAQSQKGNNHIQLISEAGFPTGHGNPGFGIFVKGLYGVGQSAQLTLTTGFSRFQSHEETEQAKTVIRLIPVLAGYKQYIRKFYLEPQIGYGELGGKVPLEGNLDFARPSSGAIFWGMGVGYDLKKITIGIHYQGAHCADGSAAGLWHDKNFHYIGIQVAVNIF